MLINHFRAIFTGRKFNIFALRHATNATKTLVTMDLLQRHTSEIVEKPYRDNARFPSISFYKYLLSASSVKFQVNPIHTRVMLVLTSPNVNTYWYISCMKNVISI